MVFQHLPPAIVVFDPVFVAVPKQLADFGATLTEAALSNDMLQLKDGMFFLGMRTLKSNLYIRPCYKELSKLIFKKATSSTDT